MGNWLFLMLLYAFFGWMKKKQKDKFIKKNEDNSSEKSRSIIDFGEGIDCSCFDTFSIFDFSGPNQFLDGSIDQVRIFNRALRPYEVEALYTEEYCTPTIVPSEHFNTVLYTGDDGTQAITGVGFQPDFLWFKNRSLGYGYILLDTVRGLGAPLASESSDAEYAFSYVSSVSNDGFTTASSQYPTNNTGSAIVVPKPIKKPNKANVIEVKIKKNIIKNGCSISRSTKSPAVQIITVPIIRDLVAAAPTKPKIISIVERGAANIS